MLFMFETRRQETVVADERSLVLLKQKKPRLDSTQKKLPLLNKNNMELLLLAVIVRQKINMSR